MLAEDERQIKRLPEHVASQIAAGEVVDSPAHIVKELIENAVDASASQIRIEIRSGGLDYIRVTDDGHGIPCAQLKLALQRHATSKLSALEDLFSISSFGFRGEALAAISSVSKCRLSSRIASESTGHTIQVLHGQLGVVEPHAMPIGTDMTIEALFESVPARRKFLKSEAHERERLERTVREMALANPTVQIDLIGSRRHPIQWSALEETEPGTLSDNEMHRFNQLMGLEAGHTWCHERRESDAGVFIMTAPTERLHRRDRHGMVVFVNGRVVHDSQIMRVLRMAAKPFLPPGRQPILVAHIKVPADKVDVNVHPQKSEVRFSNETQVYNQLLSTVTSVMSQVSPRSVQKKTLARIPTASNDNTPEVSPSKRLQPKQLTTDSISLFVKTDRPRDMASTGSTADSREAIASAGIERNQPAAVAPLFKYPKSDKQETTVDDSNWSTIVSWNDEWCIRTAKDRFWLISKQRFICALTYNTYISDASVQTRQLLRPIRGEGTCTLSNETVSMLGFSIHRANTNTWRLDGLPRCFPLGWGTACMMALSQIEDVESAVDKRHFFLALINIFDSMPREDNQKWISLVKKQFYRQPLPEKMWPWVAEAREIREIELCPIDHFPLS